MVSIQLVIGGRAEVERLFIAAVIGVSPERRLERGGRPAGWGPTTEKQSQSAETHTCDLLVSRETHLKHLV